MCATTSWARMTIINIFIGHTTTYGASSCTMNDDTMFTGINESICTSGWKYEEQYVAADTGIYDGILYIDIDNYF